MLPMLLCSRLVLNQCTHDRVARLNVDQPHEPVMTEAAEIGTVHGDVALHAIRPSGWRTARALENRAERLKMPVASLCDHDRSVRCAQDLGPHDLAGPSTCPPEWSETAATMSDPRGLFRVDLDGQSRSLHWEAAKPTRRWQTCPNQEPHDLRCMYSVTGWAYRPRTDPGSQPGRP